MGLLIVFGVIVLIAALIGGTYNKLVRLRESAQQMFAHIDVELIRRNDLIPNLLNTVKGYAKHESETLEAVVAARQQMVNLPDDATNEQKLAVSDALSSSLSRLMAVSESYPDLKANTNFLQLQEELTSTESRIAGSRQIYNTSVMRYNSSLKTFPTNLIAGMFSFEQMTYLEAPEEKREVPKVEF